MSNKMYYLLRLSNNQYWIRIPYYELNELNLLHLISDKSYFHNEHAYLDNNSDLTIYMKSKEILIDSFISNHTIERRADAIEHFETFGLGLKLYQEFLQRHAPSKNTSLIY